ncbi:acyl-[ACP]--phospholipid O-acyltransferase [Sulfurimonas sp.]|uniref:acyl-[ACP]--phospholipid O-acyltransferase n=1 Tax=Sulfurimonas sp. TaxID=2022749 RepID=UPI0026025845|nr:acyl-[ACP]--phospholipid O-acyltransferase [Sulfurimonas sp.]MCW8895459.1 acyl-[ACP]--phospholipid O-acyltransferase [Sulfurimonas sp.]
MKTLLNIKGFIPFIIILFINAMLDIGHKITIQNVLLKSFEGDTLIILSALINAMILLPFILLFSPSGYISDRFSKTKVIRYAAISAIFLTLLITYSYYQGWFYTSFALTFILAIQSAIYSPSKYGLIKELTGVENLATANGVVQAVTIVSILLGSVLFSIVFENYYANVTDTNAILQSIAPIGWVLVTLSIVEFFYAYKLPVTKSKKATESFDMSNYLDLSYLKKNIKLIRFDKNIWLSIIGLSIFWGVGQVMVAAFPAHYKEMTGDENAIIIQSILAVSAIGLVIGSITAGRFSKLHIELGIVPVGAVGIFGSLLLFAFSSNLYTMGIASFLFGFFGGLFIVPLNASIQYFAKDSELGTILAGNNFIQNIVMVVFLILTILFVKIGLTSSMLLIFSAIITLFGSLYSIKRLPHLFVRILLLPILWTRYNLEVRGLNNLPQSGGVLLLGNHISWIDWMLIQVASPRAVKFVMAKSIYSKWYIKWFVDLFNVIPISGTARGSFEQIKERLDNGEVVALFPEGRISYNGQLNEFKKGYEMALKDTSHPIIPFYIHGLWGSTFSRAANHFKKMTKEGSKRDIGVIFGEILPSDTDAEILKQKVTELSNTTWENQISESKPLQYSWLKRAKSQLFKRSIVDALGTDLNNAKMITAVLLFVKSLTSLQEKNVGVLLPSSSIGSIINMALLILGKRPVNLNYTLSSLAMTSAIQKADITTVISSEKFIKKLSLKGFDFSQALGEHLMMVEDIGKSFTKTNKITALLQAYLMPAWMIEKLYFADVNIDDTATILFSSGSEGTPKGIELTHKNLMANIKQVSALLNFQDSDVILNSLPIFHSFGLTVTTLLPLCEGITMVSAPDPTDAPAIGKLAARYQATIMFGTSTFFRLYNRNKKLHPLMLKSVRMVVAGAEKLKPEIKGAFKEKFGLDIFEGYGATETSPVISVNMPDSLDLDSMRPIVANKMGTVGQALPGTIVKIVDPSTLNELEIGEDGLIIVGGPQVMKGYLNDTEKTAEVIVEIDGIRYYKTGDKGHVDGDGFITIVDRYSRFAKVAGEMISLGSVEEQLENIFAESVELITVNLSDDKKGEKIVLLYNSELTEDEIQQAIKQSSMISIMHPSILLHVDELPKLASGKSDFKGAKSLAQELCK